MSVSFSSEGFDLDAATATTTSGNDVVLEIGGGLSQMTIPDRDAPTAEEKTERNEEPNDNPLAVANNYKEQGNDEFGRRNWSEAFVLYTKAIEATPGHPTGAELKHEQEVWEEEQNRLARQRLLDNDKQRKDNDKQPVSTPPPEFAPSATHPHAEKLAVFHANRAATSMQLEHYEEAVDDCDKAILLHPQYVKAFIRRSTAWEKLDQTDKALRDAQKALQLDPRHPTLPATVKRLTKVEEERLEKLKEETLGKLKDLGNTILGNFGLSLDNFKAQQDPNTGSYSISFQQNK